MSSFRGPRLGASSPTVHAKEVKKNQAWQHDQQGTIGLGDHTLPASPLRRTTHYRRTLPHLVLPPKHHRVTTKLPMHTATPTMPAPRQSVNYFSTSRTKTQLTITSTTSASCFWLHLVLLLQNIFEYKLIRIVLVSPLWSTFSIASTQLETHRL